MAEHKHTGALNQVGRALEVALRTVPSSHLLQYCIHRLDPSSQAWQRSFWALAEQFRAEWESPDSFVPSLPQLEAPLRKAGIDPFELSDVPRLVKTLVGELLSGELAERHDGRKIPFDEQVVAFISSADGEEAWQTMWSAHSKEIAEEDHAMECLGDTKAAWDNLMNMEVAELGTVNLTNLDLLLKPVLEGEMLADHPQAPFLKGIGEFTSRLFRYINMSWTFARLCIENDRKDPRMRWQMRPSVEDGRGRYSNPFAIIAAGGPLPLPRGPSDYEDKDKDGPEINDLSPEMAELLWSELQTMAQKFHEGTGGLLLPQKPLGGIVQQYYSIGAWRTNLVQCALRVASRVSKGKAKLAEDAVNCAGEVLVLIIAIRQLNNKCLSRWLENTAQDLDIEMLFKGNDHLMMPETSPMAMAAGVAHLHPAEWFIAFDSRAERMKDHALGDACPFRAAIHGSTSMANKRRRQRYL